MKKKKNVKTGDRVKLVYTNDSMTRLRPGDKGTVFKIEKQADDYLIWIHWDNNDRLALIEGIDKFEIVED